MILESFAKGVFARELSFGYFDLEVKCQNCPDKVEHYRVKTVEIAPSLEAKSLFFVMARDAVIYKVEEIWSFKSALALKKFVSADGAIGLRTPRARKHALRHSVYESVHSIGSIVDFFKSEIFTCSSGIIPLERPDASMISAEAMLFCEPGTEKHERFLATNAFPAIYLENYQKHCMEQYGIRVLMK